MAIHFKDVEDAWIGKDTFLGHFFRQMGKPVTKVYIRYGKPVFNGDHKILQTETREQIDKMLQDIIDNNIN